MGRRRKQTGGDAMDRQPTNGYAPGFAAEVTLAPLNGHYRAVGIPGSGASGAAVVPAQWWNPLDWFGGSGGGCSVWDWVSCAGALVGCVGACSGGVAPCVACLTAAGKAKCLKCVSGLLPGAAPA